MSGKSRVLLVEDDGDWLDIYHDHLQSEEYLLDTARSVNEAFKLLEESYYDAVITDLKMLGFGNDFGGFSILQKTKKVSPSTQVVIITAYGTQEIAFRATQQGAFDYVVKPPEPDKFRMSVQRAIQASRQLSGTRREEVGKAKTSEKLAKDTKKEIVSLRTGHDSIIGNSVSMQAVFSQMSKASTTSFPLLLWGEAGTGKRLIARAIHANSDNANKRLSDVSSTNLIAYEEAIFRNLRYLRGGGTIFLHDIGNLGVDGQSILKKLLLVIDSLEIKLIASLITSETDLSIALHQKQIQQTLIPQLVELPIYVPPLRHRKEDIPALAGHFINIFVSGLEPTPQIELSQAARNLLVEYDYVTDNVKELYDVLQNAFRLLGGGGEILIDHLPTLTLKKNYSSLQKSSLSLIRKFLVRYFDESELESLCFELEIDYENLRGSSKSIRAKELVAYCERRGQIKELVKTCRQLRPNASWSNLD